MFKRYRILLLLPFALFLASCTPRYLTPQSPLTPQNDKALVRFISPKAVGYVFDSEKVIGYAYPRAQFDYLASPGKHLFITSLKNKAFMEADLEAGKTYYVLMRRYEGVWRVRIAFLPVKKDSGLLAKAKKYEKKAKKYELKSELKDKWQRKFGPKMQAIIKNYREVKKDAYNWPKLDAEDGI